MEKLIESVIARTRQTQNVSNLNIPPEEDKLTQNGAAELFNVSVQTIIQWKKHDLIPFYQVGRSVFFSKTELLRAARNNPKLVKLPKD